MWSIERRHFQWLWTTPDLVFKVTPFFDTEYLTHGYRYGYSYYRRRKGNHTQVFKWHQCQWHWVTSNPDFKVTVLFNVKKTRKWYKIELYLQWLTNRILHMVYRMAPFTITWTTPNLVFKVTPFFDTEYLTNGYRYGHSYYGRRIGNCTQACECYHSQWPSVTFQGHKLLNGSDFNDLEWPLTQISRSRYYSTSNNSKMVQDRAVIYNGRPIESRMWSIERCHFQWLWTTPDLVSNGTSFNDIEWPLTPISRSRYYYSMSQQLENGTR